MNLDYRAKKAAEELKNTVNAMAIPPSPAATSLAAKAKAWPWVRSLEWSAGLAVLVLVLGIATSSGLGGMVAGQFANSGDGALKELGTGFVSLDGYDVTIVSPEDESGSEVSHVLVVVETTSGLEVEINGDEAEPNDGYWKAEVELEPGWNQIKAVAFLGDQAVADHTIEVFYEEPVTTEPTTTTTEVVETTTTTTEVPETTTATKPKETTTTKAEVEYGMWITSHESGFETDSATIVLQGESQGWGDFVIYTGAGEFGFEPQENGNWSREITLAPGWNTVWAKIWKNGKKVAHDTVEIYYAAPDAFDYAIAITSPSSGFETEEAGITVTGTSKAGEGEVTVYVEGSWFPVEPAADGSWSVNVELSPGWNTVWAKIYVNDVKVAYDTVDVNLNVPMAEFTASQVNGSSTVASDVFYGLATPNGQVKVFSDYGYVVTTADGEGNYEVELVFEGAPLDSEFSVYVKDLETGRKIYLGFTHLSE